VFFKVKLFFSDLKNWRK